MRRALLPVRWAVTAAAVAATAAALSACALTPQPPPALIHGPYQDVSQGIDPADPRIARMPWESGTDPSRTLIWAFASGRCGDERWGNFDTAAFAARNVADFSRERQPYVVSTGGEIGVFTCESADGLRRFVARYDSPMLRGVDFDIEGRQTAQQIGDLVRAAAELQRERPELRFSFTLATHAATDGSLRSLNATGEQVMAALAAADFDRAVINLMVMNYGPPDPRWCAVAASPAAPAHCDMGASALQAARNVHARYGVPYGRIALTAMLGQNNVEGNVFTPDDARTLVRGARALGLAGVHDWSLLRDQPCQAGSERVSPACHGLPGVPPGRFGALLGAPSP